MRRQAKAASTSCRRHWLRELPTRHHPACYFFVRFQLPCRRHHTHRQAKAASSSRWRRWLEQLPMMYPTALTPILIGLIVGIMVRLLV